jgi:glycerol uptake facilitator-like aquaporin
MLLDALLICVLLMGWGAQATAPWRLAAAAPPAGDAAGGAGEEAAWAARGRRLWRYSALPLAVGGLIAAAALAIRNPDATVAAHLTPLLASGPGRALAVLAPALCGAALIYTLAGARLDRTSSRVVAGFGLAATAAAAWAGEALRAGDGPPSATTTLALLALCRLALAFAAGDLVTPGRPRWGLAGGLALAAYLPLLPPELRRPLLAQGLALTCCAGAALVFVARWLPAGLRRAALLLGLLLGAIVLAQAGRASQMLAPAMDFAPDLPSGR